MSLTTEWVRYGNEGQYSGYLARPERAASLPAVVVLQEIWGVDTHIQDVTRRIAQAGYVALAPDLYAKGGDRPAALAADRIERVKSFLDSLPPAAWGNQEQRDEALARLPVAEGTAISETQGALFGGLGRTDHAPALLAATAFLRDTYAPSKDREVCSVGFCMGGALSAQLACHDSALAGAAIFYGSAPAQELLPKIQCPVIGFYGQLDARITDGVPSFAQAMEDAGKPFDPHVYEGAHHAFFNDTRSSYHADAARDAFARLLTFFNDATRA